MRFLVLVSLFLTGSYLSNAQWSHVNSTWNNGYDLNFVSINETAGVLIAGGTQLSGAHIIKSTDGGNTWTTINTSSNAYSSGVVINASTYVVVGDDGGGYGRIWNTTNGGASWTQTLSASLAVYDVAYNGSALVAVGENGLIRVSTNNGANWSTITTGISTTFRTVIWDPLQSKWIIGGDQHRLVSSDINGGSWTSTLNAYRITHLSFNNKLVETRRYNTGPGDSAAVIIYDNLGNISNQPRCGFQPVMRSVNTSDNRILAIGEKKFFELDLAANEFAIGMDSLYNPPVSFGIAKNILDLDICSSYAIAVGKNGSMARYDLANALQTYAPADFYIPDTVSTCPGATFVAIPICSQADTYTWYMDTVLISTEDTLIGTWPNTNTSFPLKLITTSNGIQSIFTDYIQVNNYITFPDYTLTVDTTICYGDNLSVHATFQPGAVSEFYFQLLSNNNVIGSGPVPAQPLSQTAPLMVYNMTNSIDLEVQLFKTGVCGTSYQSNEYTIHVGPNLAESYTLVSADPGICSSGDSIHFSLTNLIPGATYILQNTEFYDGYYTTPFSFDTIIGAGTDTLNLVYAGDQFYFSQMAAENVYTDTDVSNYFNAAVTYDGCSATSNALVNFDITNPNANFSIVDQPTIIEDTLNIVNLQISDTSSWNISPLTGIASALTDTVPLLAPDVPGEYLVKVVNTTRFGCTDSIVKTHVAGSLLDNNILSTTCFATKLPSMSVLGSVVDNHNNLIEFGYYSASVPQWTGFAIRKLDSLGTLLWEKTLEYGVDFWGGTHLATAIDIDADDNIYAAVRLKDDGYASFPLHFESINLPDGYNTGYILKWSPGGQLLANYPTGLDVSDIEVANNQVHVVGIGAILTLSTNLTLMNNYVLNGYGFQDNIYTYGSNPESLNEWNWKPRYPKITSLPNGKIILISDIFVPTSSVTVSPGVTIIPNSINAQVVFGAEYTPNQGLSNPKKIFEIPFNPGNQDRMGMVADLVADEDNHIYILTDPKSNRNLTFFDSLITTESDQVNKSFIAKLDSDLNPEWIIHSNLSKGSMDYAIGTGKLYLTGTLKNKLYVGSMNDFQVINGGNQDINQNDETFYAVINKQGSLVAGGAFGQPGIWNRNKVVCAVSKCGELFISQDSKADDSWSTAPYTYGSSYLHVEINGTDYAVDSNYVFKLTETACFGTCPYLILSATEDLSACASDSLLYIPVYDVHYMDSAFYEILQNNVVISDGYAPVVNQSIEIPNTIAANQSLVVHGTIGSPLTDTLQVQTLSALDPMAPTYYVECFANLVVNLSSVNFPSVYWTNAASGSSSHQLFYSANDFVVGDTVQYSVAFTDLNGCSSEDFFEIIYCDDLSLNSLASAKISLAPNPAESTITLRLDEGILGLSDIRIFNAEGREVLSDRIQFGQEVQLNIEFLTKGFYLIKLKSEQDSSEYSFRFVKQ